jgi:hypothetical protein
MTDKIPVPDELGRRLVTGRHDAAASPASSSGGRRLRLAVAVAPAVIAAAVVVAVVLSAAGGSKPSPAARALDDAADAALGSTVPILQPGQYWYTRTISSSVLPWPLLPRVFRTVPTHPQTVPLDTRESVETWIGLDRTLRRREVPLSIGFPSAGARARWRRSGAQLPNIGSIDSITAGDGRFPPEGGGGGDAGDGLFTYRQLLALPTSPASLRVALVGAQAGLDRREEQGLKDAGSPPSGSGQSTGSQMLTSKGVAIPLYAPSSLAVADSSELLMTITSLLTAPVPPAVRAALYRLAATLPGVVYDGRARDALGRAGVEVQLGHGSAGWRMIFDPNTGELLQTALLTDNPAATAAGFGGITETFAARGVSDSIRSVPPGFPPSPGRLPPARTASILPLTGLRSTTVR